MTLASHADNNAQHELIIYKPAISLPRTIAPSPHPFSTIDPVTVALFVADQPHLNYSVTSTSTRANTRHAAATPHQAEVNATLDIAHVLPSRLSCSSLSASLTLSPHHHQCAPLTEVQTSIAQHEAPLQRHRSCAFCNCSFSYNKYRQHGQNLPHAVSGSARLHQLQ
jgi:hypothetical protein